jgi:signal peptidase I
MTSPPAPLLRWLGALAALLAVVGLWYEVAPGKLGGSHEYAVVDGISMNPKLHAGDLVLLHPAASYDVGDVVGYHNRQLGRLVLHRIVGKAGERYVFKGDNNSFLDAYHPTRNELVGRLSFSVPKIGGLFTWLHAPHHAAVTVAIVAFLLLASGGAGVVRHRRRHGRRIKPAMTPNPSAGRALLTSAASIAVVSGLVLLIGASHATTTTVDKPGAYQQQGAYAYSARVAPNSLYPSGRVTTGQTVFTRVVDQIATSFDYRFVSALPHSVSGTAGFDARLQSSSGWTKKLHSQTVPFKGDQVRVVSDLDVRSLERQVAQYAKLTGLGNDSFTVVLTPAIDVEGTVGGNDVSDAFAPAPLTFALDGYSLRLQQQTVQAQPGTAAADALHPTQPGVVPHGEAASVSLLVAKVHVTTARWTGIAGLALAALLALAGFVLSGRTKDDELTKIRRLGGGLLVPVSSPPAPPHGGYVDVANFDSLAHIARSYHLMILHHQRGDAHSFYIDDDGSIYRYSVRAA